MNEAIFTQVQKEMDGSVVVLLLARHPGEKSIAHGVMRIGNREALWFPKESSC